MHHMEAKPVYHPSADARHYNVILDLLNCTAIYTYGRVQPKKRQPCTRQADVE